jgi:hypothetical protein
MPKVVGTLVILGVGQLVEERQLVEKILMGRVQ